MLGYRNLSIRNKIILIAMSCTLSALLVFVLFSDLYLSHQRRVQIESELNALAILLAERSTAALQFGDVTVAAQNLSALRAVRDVVNACLYDDKGQLFAHYHNQPGASDICPDSAQDMAIRQHEDFLLIPQAVVLDDVEIGQLYLQASLKTLEQLLFTYLLFSLLFGAAAALISFVFAARLHKVITGPINRLRSTIADIEATQDFSLRALQYSPDEIGELVQAFNHMLDRLDSENRLLSESETRFRTLATASPFGIFQVDEAGNSVYVNECYRELTGIHTPHITLSVFLKSIHPQDRESVKEMLLNAHADRQAFNAEFSIMRADDTVVHTICQAKPIFDADSHFKGFIGSLADVSELKQMQAQLERLAFYDPLTGLANRRLFRNRLEKTIRIAGRSGKRFALLFIDFDQFKRINDTLGHDRGDELLVAMARRIQLCLRPSDTLSRLGGDEFTVLVPDLKERRDADVIARKILKVLGKPVQLHGLELTSTCSIGITVFPDDAVTADALMKNADLAMYKSKETGRNRFHYFSESMNTAINRQMEIENDLRLAITAAEFELYFQPKIYLDRHALSGYEALIRWHHPVKGMILPGEFIPVAEDTGLISDIGRWVIEEVCRKIPDFLRQGLLPAGCRVAINLSAKQFRDPELVPEIRQILGRYAVDPKFLELEITESLIMNDIDIAIRTLDELRGMGIEISIDDFGTGYSSFNYLKRLPIDYIKVDQSFVTDIPHDRDDMEITSAIIAMAHSLRLKVIAEGLETLQQKEFLQLSGCDIVQGYFFGHPMPLEKLSAFFNSVASQGVHQIEAELTQRDAKP